MIDGNRPILRAKGLKKKAINWTVKGEIKYQSNVNQAIKQIEDYLEPKTVKKKPAALPADSTFGKSIPAWRQKRKGGSTLSERSKE